MYDGYPLCIQFPTASHTNKMTGHENIAANNHFSIFRFRGFSPSVVVHGCTGLMVVLIGSS